MEILRLISAKLLEPLYFSLFLIIGKDLKKKRLLFTLIMIFEYIMLTSIVEFNVALQFIYTFMTYLTLKVLYREKAQITDIFLFAAASIILIIVSVISYLSVYYTIKNYYVAMVLNRVILFTFLYFSRNKIRAYYVKFYSLWNRRHKPKKNQKFNIKKHQCYYF